MSSMSVESLSAKARLYYAPAVLALALLLGQSHGLAMAILAVGAGALGCGIWLFWTSLQGLAANAPLSLEEAMSLGAPSAEEEQKRSILRALKDLEYEKAVGKINDKDYQTLTARYRKDALRLLQIVDKDLEPHRQQAEKKLEERLSALSSQVEGKATVSAATESTKSEEKA